MSARPLRILTAVAAYDGQGKRIAILANDPTTSNGKTASAFLADRVRLNNLLRIDHFF